MPKVGHAGTVVSKQELSCPGEALVFPECISIFTEHQLAKTFYWSGKVTQKVSKIVQVTGVCHLVSQASPTVIAIPALMAIPFESSCI